LSFGIDGTGGERRFSRPPDEYLVRPRVTDCRIKAKRKGCSSEFGAFIFIARLPCLRVNPRWKSSGAACVSQWSCTLQASQRDDSQLACNYRINSLRRIYRWRVGEQLPSKSRHGADYPDQVKFSASTLVPPMFRRAELPAEHRAPFLESWSQLYAPHCATLTASG